MSNNNSNSNNNNSNSNSSGLNDSVTSSNTEQSRNASPDILEYFNFEECDAIRVKKLMLFHEYIVEKTLSEFPFEIFIKLYAKLSPLNIDPYLTAVYNNIVLDSLQTAIRNDFQMICNERNVIPKLIELEKLIRDQPTLLTTGKRCPPMLNYSPDEIIKSNIVELKIQERVKLVAQYKTILEEKNQMNKTLVDLETRKLELMNLIEQKCKNISHIVEQSKTLDQ
ncbi:hypothetical protein CYY_005735 [Polysphondylium violaceum]|uniref:Uncharacterized protein n=1 Tax=Polysphondylium violaceum TaxID=133409 RepID=A0A8J4PT10_9MYCE|nr:hypothetical protein CYY_005735 [Polysphondylium violaceum]